MIGKALDKLIGVFAPERAARRIIARGSLAQVEQFSGGTSGYEAGRLSRQTRPSPQHLHVGLALQHAFPRDKSPLAAAVPQWVFPR